MSMQIVTCGECINFIRDSVNPKQGLGDCKIKAKSDSPYGKRKPEYPMAPRYCKKFNGDGSAIKSS